ncbi:hypothetical protein U8527_05985 [Kordia algicida OT-1]|uniref:Uncharacterized protein n=1 Tax=Kordia algicida OT-1 TaxID=391587 RepID=A9E126_9FLAO|nr:hypothetical protein [Kordia algicida]EDP95573.1 hypothetical protein KAOT1_22016 [Kordia algicida OT-1]
MKLKPIVFLVAITFILISCLSTDKEIIPVVKKEKRLFPVLIDTLAEQAEYLETKIRLKANYKPITFKKITDTIFVNHDIYESLTGKMSETEYQNYMRYHRTNIIADNVTKPTANTIKIFVDTTAIISKIYFNRHAKKLILHKAYATYVVNTSVKDTVVLGLNSKMDMLLEALNKENEWKQIEGIQFIACATGRTLFVLPEKDTLITETTIFKGNFKTKLCLKLGSAYSNQFEGFIHETQLLDSDVDFY